jgi:hypothetical protein
VNLREETAGSAQDLAVTICIKGIASKGEAALRAPSRNRIDPEFLKDTPGSLETSVESVSQISSCPEKI